MPKVKIQYVNLSPKERKIVHEEEVEIESKRGKTNLDFAVRNFVEKSFCRVSDKRGFFNTFSYSRT